MHHAKSDSEVTSLPGSSPPRSPRTAAAAAAASGLHLLRPHGPPPAYYVQSPSRDSHDGDSKLSFQSTPLLSPLGSPLHPHGTSSHHHHQRPSSDARSSVSNTTGTSSSRHLGHKIPSRGRSKKQPLSKTLPTTIFEEDDPYNSNSKINSSLFSSSQIYSFLLLLFSCAVFLALFILFFWLICKPSRPALSVKNIIFHNLFVAQGTDASGVPSMLLTVNSTTQIDFENRSKYFGAHLDPLSIQLAYSELSIATTEIYGLVQSKNSRKVISIPVSSSKVPLYGASIISSNTQTSIPLSLSGSVCSRYYIVGVMVKSKFCTYISCNVNVNSKTMALVAPVKNACTYSPPT